MAVSGGPFAGSFAEQRTGEDSVKRLLESIDARIASGNLSTALLRRWHARLLEELDKETKTLFVPGHTNRFFALHSRLLEVLRLMSANLPSRVTRLESLSWSSKDACTEKVEHHRQLLRQGRAAPSVVVDKQREIIDGRHRATAAELEGRTTILAVFPWK